MWKSLGLGSLINATYKRSRLLFDRDKLREKKEMIPHINPTIFLLI